MESKCGLCGRESDSLMGSLCIRCDSIAEDALADAKAELSE